MLRSFQFVAGLRSAGDGDSVAGGGWSSGTGGGRLRRWRSSCGPSAPPCACTCRGPRPVHRRCGSESDNEQDSVTPAKRGEVGGLWDTEAREALERGRARARGVWQLRLKRLVRSNA